MKENEIIFRVLTQSGKVCKKMFWSVSMEKENKFSDFIF